MVLAGFVHAERWTITCGPMFHWNWGAGDETRYSIGFELSLWRLWESVSYGVDVGIEFEKDKLRYYTEGQIMYLFDGGISTGVLPGLSAGIVGEKRKVEVLDTANENDDETDSTAATFTAPTKVVHCIGFQGSIWTQTLLMAGLDCRYRRIYNTSYLGNGISLKIPPAVILLLLSGGGFDGGHNRPVNY
jgi:hypothetical protein